MTWVYNAKEEAYVNRFSFAQLGCFGLGAFSFSCPDAFHKKSSSLFKGRIGEAILCHFFLTQDYLKFCTLFRSRYGEIDQVWQKGDRFLLLEVRTRYLATSFSLRDLHAFVQAQWENYALFPGLKKAKSLHTGAYFNRYLDENNLGCVEDFWTAACFIRLDFEHKCAQVHLQLFDWLTEDSVMLRD